LSYACAEENILAMQWALVLGGCFLHLCAMNTCLREKLLNSMLTMSWNSWLGHCYISLFFHQFFGSMNKYPKKLCRKK